MNCKDSLFAACVRCLICALLAYVPSVLAQQTFPSRPIKIIVPFSAGGGGDLIARKIAARLGERTGVSVVVENRVGASGNIGAELVVNSPPDGYTLLSTSSTYGVQAAVAKLSYDPLRDVTPIIGVSRSNSLYLVSPTSKIKSLRDLIAEAKRRPGEVSYGSAGVGAIAHMQTEELASVAGIKLLHIPYKGTSQAYQDMLGGRIDLLPSNPVMGTPLIKSGRVHALAIGGESRLATLPEVPTFAEAGLPGYSPYDWKALLGPKGIPREVVAKLNSEVNAILKEKDFIAVLDADGSVPIGGTPEQLLAMIKVDIEKWRTLIRERNIKLE